MMPLRLPARLVDECENFSFELFQQESQIYAISISSTAQICKDQPIEKGSRHYLDLQELEILRNNQKKIDKVYVVVGSYFEEIPNLFRKAVFICLMKFWFHSFIFTAWNSNFAFEK